jgi:hypothetical protein
MSTTKTILAQILTNITEIGNTMGLIAQALGAVDAKATDATISDADLAALQSQIDAQAKQIKQNQDDIKTILAQIKKK